MQVVKDRINQRECVKWHDENGKLHRDNDLPAVTWSNGVREWWRHGVRHRLRDQPALIVPRKASDLLYIFSEGEINMNIVENHISMYKDGDQEWWVNGERHRDGDKAAVDRYCSRLEWWKNDKRHRDGDKPAVIYSNGPNKWWNKEWWINGLLHRNNNLPAVDGPNRKEWWEHGVLLRSEPLSSS